MSPRFYEFDRALVRLPGASAARGLRRVDRGAPSLTRLGIEHCAYVRALEAARVTVETLPALEPYPDALFVEDPALVFAEGAVVLRAGAASRAGEAQALLPALRARFGTVLELPGKGSVEGGDVLALDDRVLIGLSARTSREGAEALAGCLAQLGRRAELVAVPEGVLHFKSDCSALDERTVLATSRLAQSSIFTGLRVLTVPTGEEPAANALRVNGTVLLSEGYPRTATLLEAQGYRLHLLATTELAKLDAGLSCLSLRWRERA